MSLFELKVFLVVASAVILLVFQVVGICVFNGVRIYLLILKDKREQKNAQNQKKRWAKKPNRR